MPAWDAQGAEALELVGPYVDQSAAEILEQLDEREGQALFGFARRLGMSDEQADDVVQEVLLRLWTELRHGTDIVNPRGWVYRVMYRTAMDQHRLRRRFDDIQRRLAEATRGAPGVEAPGRHDDRLAVWAEVAHLPERQRHVIYLRYRADLPYDQIGGVLGITPSAARSHATQALATLRRRLSAPGEEA